MNPVISVIIPVHNAEVYLRECLDSVLAQTLKELEVLCVENDSTDASLSILQQYAAKDNRVKVLRSRLGVSAARNVGIDKARGEWLTFVDADDAIAPFALKMLLAAAIKGKASAVASGIERVTEIPHPRNPGRAKVDLTSGENAIVFCLHQKGMDSSVCGKLFQASLFADSKLRFRSGRFEDLDIIYRIYDRCRRVCILRETIYYYRINPDSFIENIDSQGRFDMLLVTDRMRHYTQLYSTRVKRAVYSRSLAAAYNALGLIYKHHLDRPDLEKECLKRLKRLRSQVLLTKDARRRDRIGALLAFLPISIVKKVITRYYNR